MTIEPLSYRIDCAAHDAYDGSYTGGLPDPISFLVDDGVLVPAERCVHYRFDGHWVREINVNRDDRFRDVKVWCDGAGLEDSDAS